MLRAPGRNHLKVTGILYIILGGIGAVLFSILLLTPEPGDDRGLFGFFVLHAGYYIFMGIIGGKYCENRVWAYTLRTFGVADIILVSLVCAYRLAIAEYEEAIVALLLSLPLPILYIVGASKNERMEAPPPMVAAAAWGQPVENVPRQIDMDRLRKLKTLRDEGILTQEEFEAKKRELLGL